VTTPNSPKQVQQAIQQIKSADILLASTTVASLAVALVVFSLGGATFNPATTKNGLVSLVIIKWGSLQFVLPPLDWTAIRS
jgi:hypothetical protein